MDVIRIRVITSSKRGVNVNIPLHDSEELYDKYRHLRFLILNSDRVMVAFDDLYVCGSPFHRELYLRSYDFFIADEIDDYKPSQPHIEI